MYYYNMYYYNIEMRVPGPYVSIPVGAEEGVPADDPVVVATKKATENIATVAAIARTEFPKIGIKIKHAYSWPDGSLYYFGSSSLYITLNDLNNDFRQHVISIKEIKNPEKYDPFKHGFHNLVQYMNAPDNYYPLHEIRIDDDER